MPRYINTRRRWRFGPELEMLGLAVLIVLFASALVILVSAS